MASAIADGPVKTPVQAVFAFTAIYFAAAHESLNGPLRTPRLMLIVAGFGSISAAPTMRRRGRV
jgi:hypothetical protein